MSLNSTISDEKLILLIKSKNKDAFSYLYDKYAPPLYGIICKMVTDEATATEVLEKTFISIWKRCASAKSIKGGLFILMHNIARNEAMKAINTVIQQEEQKYRTNHYPQRFVRAFGALCLS